ncbi:LysR family transcriptional regulator [Salinisphaera sp. SPP-AMP-43]|uniref:LysR family transcriptional regulator n=1 Tax=Salinisphaera sp. SPP-AMP-43 TaxID=3121288 RepID=UPI003C6DC979
MKLADLDLKSLAVFRAVADQGGFAGASSTLHMSQSAISFHISGLEKRLGFRVCRRGRGGFELTDRGAIAYERVKSLLASVDDFDSEMGGLRDTLVGTLRLGIVDNTITDDSMPYPQILGEFLRRNAGVDLDVSIESPEYLVTHVANGQLHLALVPETNRIQGLQYHPVHQERHSVYCAAQHPLFDVDQEQLSLDTVAAHPFVAHRYADRREQRIFDGVQVGAEVSNMEAQAMLILSGRFIGYLPDHYARRWCEQNSLCPILPASTGMVSSFYIVTRAGKRASLVVRSFIQELVAHSSKMAHEGVMTR